jgi:hypothetical protein
MDGNLTPVNTDPLENLLEMEVGSSGTLALLDQPQVIEAAQSDQPGVVRQESPGGRLRVRHLGGKVDHRPVDRFRHSRALIPEGAEFAQSSPLQRPPVSCGGGRGPAPIQGTVLGVQLLIGIE